jgi:hypothetical protein
MKKLVFAAIAAAVLALPVCAQSITAVVDIPFDYVAANATLPAGGYTVNASAGSTVVALLGPDLHTHLLSSIPDDARSSPGQSVLVFQRYGDRYFLSEVRTESKSRQFPASRMEREAMKTAGAERTRQEIVVAMR